MNDSMKVIFMGTPEFAVPSLRILVENNVNVVAVITAPDRPKGRGRKVAHSAVKEYALSCDLPLLQPTNLKDPDFHEELKSFQADIQVVVAFRMLPESVWNMPKLGTFNLHGSLLPQYRGAAPINWAIINGEKETGVTTFFLQHKIDTGDIIFQEKEPIAEQDTVGDVYERLMHLGASLVLKTIRAVADGKVTSQPQQMTKALKSAPKIFKETCEIDWTSDSEEIRNLVRGLCPYPAAWTTIHGKKAKVFKVVHSDRNISGEIGKFVSDGKEFIAVVTGSGVVEIADIQLEGKKRMSVEELLRGYQWPK